MHILITGAAGFIGQHLTEQLLDQVCIDNVAITQITLLSRRVMHRPGYNGLIKINVVVGNVTDREVLNCCLEDRPDIIFHLAAVVSSQAEKDLKLGMHVNFDATRLLIEQCIEHSLSDCRLVMTSSIAAYGGDIPEVISDMTAQIPQNSYGAQKAMAEILINDYSRRGLIDGCVLRLPTIIVRPGSPNAAASSFASSIFREPLNGEKTICPVPTNLELFIMSPRCVIDSLIRAAIVSSTELGSTRSITLPGITVKVEEMLETLEKIGGRELVKLVEFELDADITKIVSGFPARFDVKRAKNLGFMSDDSLLSIVNDYIATADQDKLSF